MQLCTPLQKQNSKSYGMMSQVKITNGKNFGYL